MSFRLLVKIIGALLFVLLIYFLGPQPSFDQTITFKTKDIGEDVDAYLAEQESRFTDIRPGLEKGVVWNDPVTKAKTDISIVYLHGFTASRAELSPVMEEVGKALGANIFFTRLSGHGRGSQDMASITMGEWANDAFEAITIAAMIGERVIVIGTSTGGTLASWAAAHPALSPDIAGLVLISPNFKVNATPTYLLTMPWGEILIPLIMGENIGTGCDKEPDPLQYAWTSCYPSVAVQTMGAIMATVDEIKSEDIDQPTLFIYSKNDTVIEPDDIERRISDWGGPTDIMVVENSADKGNHVIAGDARSPENNGAVIARITQWIRDLN